MALSVESSISLDVITDIEMTKVNQKISEKVRIDLFLASVQTSGYRMAQLATSNIDDAMDLVQESMLQLVKRYSDRADNELKILFYRILSSRITDWHRKKAFRKQFKVFFSSESYQQGDPVQQLSSDHQLSTFEDVENSKKLQELCLALKNLSHRQHQAFLLRAWQGFNVKETATIMNCSTGSVKTHYWRALKALQVQLGEDD